jgi:F-type H+-transporting ATPase subunit delta
MAESIVARRYAKALIALGQEESTTDTLVSELEGALATLMSGEGELFAALSHPTLMPSERQALLDTLIPKLGLTGHLKSFLSILIEKRRFAALPTITSEARIMADAIAGRAVASVTTARALTPALEAEVKTTLEMVTGKTITINTSVDDSLIGGMVAQVGSRVYDASLRTRLSDIRNSLLESKSTTSVGDA